MDWSKYMQVPAWKAFIAYLHQGERPTDFRNVWRLVRRSCCMYHGEMQALWDILRAEEIHAVVEIGRGRSASSFLIACACRDLKRMRTIDITDYEESDRALESWFKAVGIDGTVEVADSGTVKPDRLYDVVWVDGSHMQPAVAQDIEIWRHHTRLMGFHDFDKPVHGREWPGVALALANYNWRPVGVRGHSEIVFDVGNRFWRCDECRELFLPEVTAAAGPLCGKCMLQREGLE